MRTEEEIRKELRKLLKWWREHENIDPKLRLYVEAQIWALQWVLGKRKVL